LRERYRTRRIFTAVKGKIHDLLNGPPKAWYLTEYATDTTALGRTEPPSASELPGTIFHHHLDPDSSGGHFISYWESREDFEANRLPLEGWLGVATLQRAGWVRRISVESKPFWKRTTLYYGLLLHIVAVLGALVALEDYKAWLFEEPMIALDVEAIEPINLTEGSPFYTHLLLINQRANVAAKISDLRAQLKSPARPGFIPLGHSHELGKEGSLRIPIRTQALGAGLYQLEVQGRGRSGLLGGWEPLQLSRDVKVWSLSPQIELSLVPDSPSRAELKGVLHLGEDAPNGLDCFVNLVREPSLRFGPMEFRGVTNWPDPTVSDDRSVSHQSWTTPPLHAFSNIKFSLFIEGQPSGGWEQTAGKVTSECHKSIKEIKP
jgi:hypothetical protein